MLHTTKVWTTELDELLRQLADECVKNGQQNEEITVTLNSILNRSFLKRTSSDWEFVVKYSSLFCLFVLDENREQRDRDRKTA